MGGTSNSIFANLLFSIPLGILMLVLFAHYRNKLPIFYHRNALCHGKPVLGFKVKNRFIDWVKELVSINDALLLEVGGLDALVTSNAFRLILVFVCTMSVPCLLILAPYYYFNSDHTDGVDFESFTIADLFVDSFWPPVLVLIFLTCLILYGIYTFYSNFVKLRQAYLLKPSSVDSVGFIARNAELFGSLKASRRRIDAATCTVMLYSIPDDLCTSAEFLQNNLEKSGISGLKSIQFIGEYSDLKIAMGARNAALAKLEGKLKTFTDKLRKKQGASESEETTETPLTIKEKSALLRNLLLNPSLHEDIRKRKEIKGSDDKASESVDSLQFYHKKFMECEEKLQEAIKEFKNPELKKKKNPTTDSASTVSNDNDSKLTENFEKRYIDQTAFISWDRVRDFEATLTHVSALGEGQAALLHFTDFRQATRAQQILMNSYANVMGSLVAPSPDAIHWRHINLSEKDRWNGALKSNFYYWLFVLLYVPFSTLIVSIIDMEGLAKWFPAIETFRLAHPYVIAGLQGVLAPLMTTILINQTGPWIYSITALRGPMSKIDLALKSQSAHINFLFIVTIFIGTVFSSTHKFASSIFATDSKTPILDHLRENIPKKSHYFFDYMLQDTFIKLMLALLNPKSFFFDRSFYNDAGRNAKTPRVLLEHDTTPPALQLAFAWSRYIVFPYFVFMVYVVISPLIVIPAIIYFSVGYYVFRFRFSQFGRRVVETGGLFWKQGAKQLIYGLILAQLSVLLQYTQFRKGIAPSVIIAILLTITILFIPFLNRHFGRICDSLSVLEDDVEVTKLVAQFHSNEQNKDIPAAVACFKNSSLVQSHLESDINDFANSDNTLAQPLEPLHSKTAEDVQLPEGITDESYVTMVPLSFIDSPDAESDTFDPLQVDALVDTKCLSNQYEHPLILKHSQVLIIPADLPNLLKNSIQ
jgi:hypothetical protein